MARRLEAATHRLWATADRLVHRWASHPPPTATVVETGGCYPCTTPTHKAVGVAMQGHLAERVLFHQCITFTMSHRTTPGAIIPHRCCIQCSHWGARRTLALRRPALVAVCFRSRAHAVFPTTPPLWPQAPPRGRWSISTPHRSTTHRTRWTSLISSRPCSYTRRSLRGGVMTGWVPTPRCTCTTTHRHRIQTVTVGASTVTLLQCYSSSLG